MQLVLGFDAALFRSPLIPYPKTYLSTAFTTAIDTGNKDYNG
jgi:hypothetical protein